jgi:hypothetical protein
MIRRFTTLTFGLFLVCATLFAQTTPVVKFTVDAFGVSSRDSAKSKTDIYTAAATGLRNVGVGTLNYFKAATTGRKFSSSITWTLTRKPSGSVATIGTVKDKVNDSTQVASFRPDLVGAYTLAVTDGQFTTSVNFNAAKYLGYTNTMVNGVDTKVSCKTCHSSIVTSYEKTAHAGALQRGLDGISSDHFGANCVSCHSTGFDATAKNDGFDDFSFTFPTVLKAGTYNSLVTQFPDAMKRANIQCESCHGPAGSHLGAVTDERIDVTYDPAPCAYCHDSGTHHIFPEQWDSSVHAKVVDESGPGREACVRCHTGAGFAQFTKGIPTTDPYFDVTYSAVTCAGCHNPHDASKEYQLRKTDATLSGFNSADVTKPLAVQVTGAGTGTLCINCHQSRSEANQAVAATISSRFGPHHGPQGDIIMSNNMLELGTTKLAKSNHLGVTGNACVTCHMYGISAPADASGNIVKVGGHSFRMSTPDGKDNVEACAPCHGGTIGTFADVKFFLYGTGDHDNDGVTKGLQEEVKGMIAKIMAKMPKTSTGAVTPGSSWTKDQAKAYWNAITAQEDRSFGIHNPKYVVTALKGAMQLVGISVGIQKQADMPTTYTLYQNYPNPFNPTTNIKFSIPQSGNVKLVVYDVLGKEVATLVNNFLSAGSYNFDFNARGLASGIYLYRIEANNFVKVNKMLLIK